MAPRAKIGGGRGKAERAAQKPGCRICLNVSSMKKALMIEPQDYVHAMYKHTDLMRKLANRLSKAKRGLKAAQKKLEEQEEIENFLLDMLRSKSELVDRLQRRAKQVIFGVPMRRPR